jgi:hypothetical protein
VFEDVRQERRQRVIDVADVSARLGALRHEELGAPLLVHRGEPSRGDDARERHAGFAAALHHVP